MSIENMKQALDALESSRVFVTTREKIKHPEGTEWYDNCITVLRQAIEQAEKQEPVAWSYTNTQGRDVIIRGNVAPYEAPYEDATPLYTHPPKREWVGLTDEEAAECWNSSAVTTWKNIEAKLREKNK